MGAGKTRETAISPNHRPVTGRDHGQNYLELGRLGRWNRRPFGAPMSILGMLGFICHSRRATRCSGPSPLLPETFPVAHGVVNLFAACSRADPRRPPSRCRTNPLRPVKSHAIPDSRRRASGAARPQGDKQASYRQPASGNSLCGARAAPPPGGAERRVQSPKLRGPEMGTRAADRAVAAARSALSFSGKPKRSGQ